MKKADRKNRKSPTSKEGRSRPVKVQTFDAFAAWMALPEKLRKPKKQGGFAVAHNVREATLSDWKNRKDFWQLVKAKTAEWGKDKTPNVVGKLYKQIMSSKTIKVEAFKLWLELFAGYSYKMQIDGNIRKHNPVEKLSDAELDACIAKRYKVLNAVRDYA